MVLAKRPFSTHIAGKVRRKLNAQRNRRLSIYFGLGMFGLVGWSVALPTLLAIVLGVWLDRRLADNYSWTLMLLIIGVVLGCLNAWHWLKRVQGNTHCDHEEKKK